MLNPKVPKCPLYGELKEVSGEPTCRAPNGNFLGNRPVGSPTPICWGADRSAPQRPDIADLSAPQRQFAGEPTGLLPNARYPTCRRPNADMLGGRHVCSPTPDIADLSAPQRQFAGEPTGLLPSARYPTCRCPSADLLGSRHVWAPTPMFDWL